MAEMLAPLAIPIWNVMNITHVNEMAIACPPNMLAKRRTMSAKGLVNTPNNSMTGNKGTGALSHQGTSGQNMSFQYSLFPNMLTISMVHKARNKVMAMFPVRLAPPGNMGIRPMMLEMNIKKKTVNR